MIHKTVKQNIQVTNIEQINWYLTLITLNNDATAFRGRKLKSDP